MIKAILFDIGGVIKGRMSEAHHRLAELLGIDYADFDKLYKEHKNELFLGKMSSLEFSSILEEQFGVRNVEKRWEQSLREKIFINKAVLRIASDLKKRYEVGAISNAIDISARINKEKGIYKIFDPLILSCEVGMRKPGKGIFLYALRCLGMKAEECVFIDDKEEHLKDPKEMGFKVIHFRNSKQLKNELERMGVEV